MIKFLDLNKQYQLIKNEIDETLKSVIESSSFIGGSYVEKFEDEFANYCGAKFCVGVGNGTDALEIAIKAFDFPKGSEIIVPANSFIATSEAVSANGLNVVFADCDKYNYTLSPQSFKEKISPKTVAVIPVHLYGHPCDMDEILKISKANNIKVIEDCAQAQGSKYKDRKVSTFGDIATFSFYPGKNLGAFGDAGAIVTNNKELAEKCKMIKNHGRIDKYNHLFEGRNSRLDALQAAVLSVKLKYLDKWNEKRNILAKKYFSDFERCGEIILPKIEPWAYSNFYVFVIRTKLRDELIEFLSANGIQSIVHYPISLPKLKAYNHLKQFNENFYANKYDKEYLSLPIGEHLDISDIDFIVETVKKFLEKKTELL